MRYESTWPHISLSLLVDLSGCVRARDRARAALLLLTKHKAPPSLNLLGKGPSRSPLHDSTGHATGTGTAATELLAPRRCLLTPSIFSAARVSIFSGPCLYMGCYQAAHTWGSRFSCRGVPRGHRWASLCSRVPASVCSPWSPGLWPRSPLESS